MSNSSRRMVRKALAEELAQARANTVKAKRRSMRIQNNEPRIDTRSNAQRIAELEARVRALETIVQVDRLVLSRG